MGEGGIKNGQKIPTSFMTAPERDFAAEVVIFFLQRQ
jgi:hypothetical protein